MSQTRKPHLWCLYEKRSQKVVNGLLFDEARAIVSSIDVAFILDWYAWREDWPDWKPVSEVEGLSEPIYRQMSVSPPPAPSNTSTASRLKSVPNNNIQSDLDFESNKFKQQDSSSYKSSFSNFILRNKKRYKKRMPVAIIGSEEQIFRTFTVDVSVGGLLLETKLPNWVTGYFKVRLGKEQTKQQVELMCCLAENQNPDERYRVVILPLTSAKDEKDLENWLVA